MIALVTGSSGFVGSHVVEALAGAGWTVRRLVRPGSATVALPPDVAARVTTHVARTDDAQAIARSGALAGVHVAFHVAGVTKARTRAEFDAGNLRPTTALLDALAQSGDRVRGALPRVVLVSSQAAAGAARAPERPVTEADAPVPVGAYGASKLAAERLVASHPGGVPWTIVRPCAVYGPRDRDFLSVFRLAARGVAAYPDTRDAWLSLVYVEDLARALVLAGTHDAAAGRTYFVAGDEAVPWPAVHAAAARAAGTRLRLAVDVPRPALAIAAAAGDAYMAITKRAVLVGREKLALGRPRWWLCSAARARAELGWAPQVPLEDGARRTHAWYAAAGWL